MNKCVHNIMDSISPITWILRLFALNYNVGDETISSKRFFLKIFFTMALLGSLDVCSMYYKITYIFQYISTSIKLTDVVQMVYDHIQYVVDLWFTYKFRGHITSGYFKTYNTIDNILSISECDIVKRKLTKLIGCFTLLWFVSSTFDFMSWLQVFGLITPIAYSIAYLYLYLKMITMLDLTSHILHIEIRLTILADLVQHYYSVCPVNWTVSTGDTNNASSPSILSLKKRIQPYRVISKNDYEEIKWLTRCYLLLTDQVDFIKRMFGFRILLNCLSLLIDIIRFTNISVRVITGAQVISNGDKYLPAASCILRMLTCVAVLVSLVHHCEKTYDQKDRIVDTIDHILINKNPNEKLRDAWVEFRALIVDRPISFNMAKFFRLDYPFLTSIASVTVTYTIILLQSMN